MKTRNLSLGVTLIALIASTFHAGIAQHSQERIISTRSQQNEPVAMTEIKVNGRSISVGKNFLADDDWMRSLAVSVKNTSDKHIVLASLDVFFPRPPGSKDLPAVFYIFHGNWALRSRPPTADERLVGIAPGETVEIGFSVQKFADLQRFLTDARYPASIERVEMWIDSVIFEDDTMWRGGLFRRDPNNPGSWNNVEPSPESQLR